MVTQIHSYKKMAGLTLLLAALSLENSFSQPPQMITLEQCYQLARKNYPLINQKDLIRKTRDYSVENASKGYLPQWNSGGQITYQSEVTGIPFKIPGFEIPTLSKTQYKVYGEIDQTIYDGGEIHLQKQTDNVNASIQDQNIEVQLYTLKDRINQVYFGILLFIEQIKQNELQQSDLEQVVKATQAAVDNGSGYRSNLDEAKVELLKSQQNNINLRATKAGYLTVLGLFINQKLDDSTRFEWPVETVINPAINRPELRVYDYQKMLYDVQQKQLSAELRPKFAAFIQGGYSLPGLNFLKTTPEFYYIGGIKMDWPLGSLYTLKNNKRILDIYRKTQDIEKETFLFNTNQSLEQQNSDIIKYQQLIKKDNDIIVLRTSIKNAGISQAQNGVITVHDFLTYVNDENSAIQDRLLHQVQLLLAEYSYKTTSGN
ncbi:MAG TPA: TolC family protein [Puia sp.]|nr:TolC family protein [Puia sp.]